MSTQKLWVGYGPAGEKASLDLSTPGSKVLLLGSRANDIAALATVSAKEAGSKPVVLDLVGALANRLSGHLDTYDYRSFLYDAFRLESPEPWHSQLISAAYAATLDLNSEEEAIINSVLQKVASEGAMASPVAIYDSITGVEGFRGFYVDKLKGRIGALRHFDAVDDQPVSDLLHGNTILDFHRAPYPQAAELAASLILAKMLAIYHSTGSLEPTLVATEAHRIFRALPRPDNPCRLLSHLLSWPNPILLSSDQPGALSPLLHDASPVRVYSSDAWHTVPRNDEKVLSNAYVLLDARTGRHESFIPRRIISKTSEYVPAKPASFASPHLTRTILENILKFPLSTRESIVQYLGPDYLPTDINSELTNLQSRECLLVEPKESGSGPDVFAYTVTEKGRKLLEELKG